MRRNPPSNQRRRGANLAWRTMDLHLHTPASSDYQEPHVTYLDILQTAEKRGLDIIAFADHNTVGGLRRLREEIAEFELLERLNRLLPNEAYRLAEYRRLLDKILLLPGFEFTATFGFHVMGVFPPEMQVRDLELLLLQLNVPRDQLDRGSVTVGATADVLTAYRLISQAGGLAIAAHANSTNGVAMRGFGFGGQTKIAFTQDPNLAALEVTDLDQKGRRTTAAFFSGSKPEYPRRMHCIMGSDAHRLNRDPHNPKNYGVGDRATDVLLEDVSFEALRALLAGSDFARIRPHMPGKAPAEFDYVQQAREEGANIVQSFHESMQQRGGKLYAVIADVCAFANTNGGTVYIGASADARQPPVGVPEPEPAIQELRTAIARMVSPPLESTVDAQTSRGKKVIRVLVPRGSDPPYAIEDNKIYVREEAETSLAVRDEIVQLVLRGHAAAGQAVAPPAVAVGAAPAGAETAADVAELADTAEPAAREEAEASAEAPAGREPRTGPRGRTATTPSRPAVAPPRTGVEIVASEVRDGAHYHTMRDLRNNSVVKNVTRTSARKLWHYAITAKESGALDPAAINWHGDIGLWKRTQKGGATRYDLVQRAEDGGLRVYFGVTEDGIHGAWKRLIEAEEGRLAQGAPAEQPADDAQPAPIAPALPPEVDLVAAELPAFTAPSPEPADALAADIAPGPEFAAPPATPGVPEAVEDVPTRAFEVAPAAEAAQAQPAIDEPVEAPAGGAEQAAAVEAAGPTDVAKTAALSAEPAENGTTTPGRRGSRKRIPAQTSAPAEQAPASRRPAARKTTKVPAAAKTSRRRTRKPADPSAGE